MPTRVEGTFANADKVSLDKLKFEITDEDGIKRTVPALDKYWVQRNILTNYQCLVTAQGRVKNGVELEEWQHEAACFCENMKFLLSCSHHVFWSYMVYEKTVLGALVSFLQNATPFYIDLRSQSKEFASIELYEEILQLVLRLICRLITNKENAQCWITTEHLRQLIYTNYLISVPMLFDLVVALGDANVENYAVLKRIFETLLKIEPNYTNDLLTALTYFKAAFRSIQTQTENEGVEGAGGGTFDEGHETPYDDVTLYTLDTAYSLSVLLEVCPEVRSLSNEIKLAQSIAHFYDSTIPFLYKNIFLINEQALSLSWLNQARLQLLKAFRSISYSIVENVLMKPEDSLLFSEIFIALLTESLSEQLFVIDYERHYPVESDMEIIKQACKALDDFKANFVVKGYQKEAESEALHTIGNIALSMQSIVPPNKLHSSRNGDGGENLIPSKEVSMEPTKANKGGGRVRDIDVEVTAVLDVLPHLGTGFVRRVLSRYDSSEEAIAAILEENLPPDLLNADQSEVYIPADPQDKLFEQTGVRHFNTYDGDAYDIMTHDNPSCIIKRGKGLPNGPKDAFQLLDDKSDLAEIKHRYTEYSLVAEDDSDNAEYDDEYDDSYEALLESETRTLKSKELKAGLANIEDISDDDDDEDNEEDQSAFENETAQSKSNDKHMNFCENPEEVRARYEARRQAKFMSKHGGNSTRTNDVVGAPKGQGQDKDTLRSRQKKEANKGMRANHNRKAGASFKRSKGMMG